MSPSPRLRLPWLLLFLLPAPAAASGFDLSIGVERLDGEFLSDDTHLLDQAYLQFEFGATKGTRLAVKVPYVRIDRTGNVSEALGGPIILGAGGESLPPWQESDAGDRESGLGDVELRTESLLTQAGTGRKPAVILVGELKWPTADEDRGLGTGEHDWGLGLDYVQPLSKVAQLLGSAAYRFMGSPEGVDFDNRLRIQIGMAFVTQHTTWRIGGESISPVLAEVPLFDATGTAIGVAEVQDMRIARGEVAVRSSSGGSIKAYVLAGLNDSSPDIGFGLVFASKPQ